MHPATFRALEPLLLPRAGVVSRQQLLRAGFDHELASREVNAGRWQRLLPGVYLTDSGQPTLTQRCHAAVLHGGRSAVISGNAACVLHGLRGVRTDDPRVRLLVPPQLDRISNEWCRLTRTTSRPIVSGSTVLPVVPIERALGDALRDLGSLGDARALACAARDQVDWSVLSEEGKRPVPGSAHLRQALQDVLDGIRSAPEGDLHDALFLAARRRSLPSYLLNPDVYLDGVFIGSPDAWLVGYGIGDEMDSRQWHGSEDQLDGTLLRHERFRRAGLLLSHVTPARFRGDPDRHLAALRSLVAERVRQGWREPEGLVVLGRGPLLPHRTPWPQVAPERRGLGGFRRGAAA